MRWTRASRVLWRRSGDRLLLKHVEAQDVVTLGREGLALWAELATPVSVAEAAGRLASQYGTDAGRLEEDLQPLLGDLERLRLVTRTGP